MMNINIKEITKSSGVYWRPTWRNIRNVFIQEYKKWKRINLNFKWIDTVTHSFTDELIWVIIYFDWEKALNKLSFKWCNNETEKMLKFVIQDRLSENINTKNVTT